MAHRTLRGSRIGSTSLQAEATVDLAPRRLIEYLTDTGKRFTVTFDADAQPPPEWLDQRSGEVGFLEDESGHLARAGQEEKEIVHRTHWDMLIERRTRDELELLLEERLRLLRARRSGQTFEIAPPGSSVHGEEQH